MLESNRTNLQQGSHLLLRIVITLHACLQHPQEWLAAVWSHSLTVAYRTVINLVFASFVSKLKSLDITSDQIQRRIDIIRKEEEEGPPQRSSDIETWWQHIRKAFGALFKQPMGIPPDVKYDWYFEIISTAKLRYRMLYQMAALECLDFKAQIANLLAKDWVTDSHSQFGAAVIFVKILEWLGLQMCIDYWSLNDITHRDLYPLPFRYDLIDRLNVFGVFTKLHLAIGCHQLHIHPDDRYRTVFVTQDGFYQ